MAVNPELIKLARRSVMNQKRAFQPPAAGGDPSQQGGDPAAAGGMPPGMPMDPSQMGGQSPMDPSMAGGAPPAGGDPSQGTAMPPPSPAPDTGAGGLTADSIRQIMQETLGQLGAVPGQSGPGGQKASGKPDLLAMSMDLFQVKKMLSTLLRAMGIEIPSDVIDGPNRDVSTGAPLPPNTPGSTSDPNNTPAPQPAAGASGAGGQQGNSAIKPITSMQGAFPASPGGDSGGGGKSAAVQALGSALPRDSATITSGKQIRNKAAALAAVLKPRK